MRFTGFDVFWCKTRDHLRDRKDMIINHQTKCENVTKTRKIVSFINGTLRKLKNKLATKNENNSRFICTIVVVGTV